MHKKTFIFLIIILVILILSVGGFYFFTNKKVNTVACAQEAMICPDGSAVGRTGPNCAFAPCPTVQDPTADWQTETNSQSGFEFKYPASFSAVNQQPKILTGDCNYNVFPDSCPNINDIVIKDLASTGGDINVIKSNLSYPSYWKNPNGEKLTINDVPYCLYQASDAGMGHVYTSYYYTIVANKQCLVVNLNTTTSNCENYLPVETGNTQQQTNYNNCLTTNQNQPKILSQIISTFKFINQAQTECNTDSDCQNGASCMTKGPLIANQPVHRVCVPKGQAVPL